MKLSKIKFTDTYKYFFVILFLLVDISLFSQSEFYSNYEKGKEAYLNSMYDRALTYFENALSESSSEYKAVIYYWTGQSHMALDNYSKAESIFDLIISDYPETVESVNSRYQKGRISFKKGSYEEAIEKMHSFLELSGDNRLNGNAYFWIGESLFFLGHKKDALFFYSKVINSYPESYKYEASVYRSELIKLGEREEELLKLLKWSHEESLREREIFIKKEKEYKQAVLAYQRKLSVLSDQEINSQVLTLRETNNLLKKQISILKSRLEDKEKEIDILKKMDNDNINNLGKTAESSDIPAASEPVNERQ